MREWLITNGIGGFASSTDLGGMNTRRYHGLLIAPLYPPRQRHLILSKVDESIEINGEKFNLFTNNVKNDITKGYKYLKKFEKEIIPIYTYSVKGIVIEKSISMIYGKNVVVITYKVANKKAKTKLNLTPLVNFRDFHSEYHENKFKYKERSEEDKTQIIFNEKNKINICVNNSKYKKHIDDIFYNMYYETEEERGFDCTENHLVPGTFEINIKPNEDKVITFVCSLEGKDGISFKDISKINGEQVIKEEIKRIKNITKDSKLLINKDVTDDDGAIIEGSEISKRMYNELVNKFIIASDNFIVYRNSRKLHTILAGYPWFLDWARDSFISFEGLLLVTKRFEIAREVLLTFVGKIKEGLIPNGFSEYDGKPLYNSVDASLLFINAVYKYVQYTNDYNFVEDKLFKTMKKIIDYYIDGIELDNNNIYIDNKDYLLVSGSLDIQNTWMDAKVNGKAVTPRNGKAVEVNALWYNALKIMEHFNSHFIKPLSKIEYTFLAKKCKTSFKEKFYNKDKNCLYDVIEVEKNEFGTTDIGYDDKIRPNQLFAISLDFPVLDPDDEISKNIFITVTSKLYTKLGLKTLAEDEEGYAPVYKGNPQERDLIYHQGITWVWLLGQYYDALKNIIKYENDEYLKEELENTLTQFRVNTAKTFIDELYNGNTINSICEIYDSLNPKKGKGAFAQAWSVSEVFRIILEKQEGF